ncbi:MAG: hypothetical protein AAGF12_00135 [Myxococcota bacterium]
MDTTTEVDSTGPRVRLARLMVIQRPGGSMGEQRLLDGQRVLVVAVVELEGSQHLLAAQLRRLGILCRGL